MMWSIIGIIVLFIIVHGPEFYRKNIRDRESKNTGPIYYVYRVENEFFICKQVNEKIFWLKECPYQIISFYNLYKNNRIGKKRKRKEGYDFVFTDKIKEAAPVNGYQEHGQIIGPYTITGFGWNHPEEFKIKAAEDKAKVIVDMLSGKFDIEMAKVEARERQIEKEKQEKEEQRLNKRFANGDYIYQSAVYDSNNWNSSTRVPLKNKTSEILRLTPLLIAADERKDEEAVGLILTEMEAVIR